ncbi:MAG: hypothetical protein ACI9KE_005546, partial [Polyangiales bacterium]
MIERSCGALVLILVGCQGAIGEVSGTTEALPPIELAEQCDPSAAPDAELLRIDRQSYETALRSLFGDENVAAVLPAVEGVPNTQLGQYRSEVGVPSIDVIQSYVDVASSIAFYL